MILKSTCKLNVICIVDSEHSHSGSACVRAVDMHTCSDGCKIEVKVPKLKQKFAETYICADLKKSVSHHVPNDNQFRCGSRY